MIEKINKDYDIVELNLKKGDKQEIKEKMEGYAKTRKEKQPLEYPNAGSVFKNLDTISAGKLIEDNNLKGYHINDAYISEKHANFIINKGNATSQDIKDLINYIKKTIKEKENIDLELEQEIINY